MKTKNPLPSYHNTTGAPHLQMSCSRHPEGGHFPGTLGKTAHTHKQPRSELQTTLCPCGAPLKPLYRMHDDWGEEYTPERVRNHARQHAAYGWAPRPWGTWSPELLVIYAEAYEEAIAESKRG